MKRVNKIVMILFILSLIIVLPIIFYKVEDFTYKPNGLIREILDDITPLFVDSNYKGVLAPLNNRNIMDEIRFYEDDQSYTINKEKVYLCLKDKKGKYYGKNMIIYVTLHEIAHVICDEIGHTEKFKQIFDELLYEASVRGIYNPSIPIVQNYCPK